jgi:hypothetical protein
MLTRPLAIIFVCFLLWGCASSGGSSNSGARRDPNLITEAELLDLPTGTAQDAIERLRPNWLRSRSATISGGTGGTAHMARVFVDGRDFGSHSALQEISLDSISEIEFMSARDATTRYGTGYPGGVILIRLKRRP